MNKKILLSSIVFLSISLSSCFDFGWFDNPTDTLSPSQSSIHPGNYPKPPIWVAPDFNEYFNSSKAGLLSSPNLQIAYGSQVNIESIIPLSAFLKMNSKSLCSATPIESDATGTWLVTAAHCVVQNKTNIASLSAINLITNSAVTAGTGVLVNYPESIFNVDAIFVRSDYCVGATFSTAGECPKFTPAEQPGGNNDIALIHTVGVLGAPESYPILAPYPSGYPAQLTNAPLLSFGYGAVNSSSQTETTAPGGYQLFYVSNYLYQYQDQSGYHYLFNAYYNSGQNAYAYLICGGDSGGGDLYWNGNNWVLVSEHTYGPNACGGFYKNLEVQSGAATNVGYYYNWLNSIISNGLSSNYCATSANSCVRSNS